MNRKTPAQIEKMKAKQKAAQQRAYEKKLQKMNDPAEREKKLQKQKEAAERQLEKQRQKQNCPEHQAKLKQKREASIQRQIDKQNSPEAIAKRQEKTKEAFEKQKAKPKKPIQCKPKTKAKTVLKSTASIKTNKPLKAKAPIKKTSMKGKARKTHEIELHNKMAEIGCIVCVNLGLTPAYEPNTHVSIHHCNGRTKEEAHEECLPLCSGHHDTPLPTKAVREANPLIFPIHAKGAEGGKKKWEETFGTQEELIAQTWETVGYAPKHSKILERVNQYKKAS